MVKETKPKWIPGQLAELITHLPFFVLLAVYIAAASWLSFRLPAFTTPNERLHYEYVALLLQTGTLPDPSTSKRMDERHQPPVYYSLVALLSLPLPTPPLDTELEPNPYVFGTQGGGNRNPFVHTSPRELPVLYVGRLVSVLFGSVALIAFYYATNKVVAPALALLTVSLIAFQPMYLFLSASLSNDLAATAIVIFILAYTTILIVQDWDPAAYLGWGLIFGMAMLTKASTIFLTIVLVTALLIKKRGTGRISRVIGCGLAATFGFLSVYVGWLFFNQLRGLDALGISRSLPLVHLLRVSPMEWVLVKPHLFTLWKSFWLDWSTGETGYVTDWFYALWGIGLILALAGWMRQRYDQSINHYLPWMHLLWILPLMALFMSFKVLMIRDHNLLVPEGRWLLPILPSLAWLAAIGFGRWWPTDKYKQASYLAALVPLVATTMLILWYIPDRHPNAKLLGDSAQIPSIAEPVGLVYDNMIKLVAIEPVEIATEQPARVSVYWQALNDIDIDYTVESQLVLLTPDSWEQQPKTRSYPGYGLSPTLGWRKGDIYRDEVVLRIGGDLYGPTRAQIRISLLDGEQKVPIAQNDQPAEIGVSGWTVVRPAKPLVPTEGSLLGQPVEFSELIDLVGVDIASNDEGTSLTLWWRSLAEVPNDYTVFVHLLDVQGHLLAQSDVMPNDGRSPTSLWRPGDMVRDRHVLPVQVQTGNTVLVGLYDLSTLERLPATQGGIPLKDQAYRLNLP